MTLAVLVTGRPPEPLGERFGDYPAMFAELLGLELASYDVAAALPERPEAHEAYIVSGSPAGVYDPLPWIGPLSRFLVEARGRAKLVGICFGHQIMAEAFGGAVAKSDKGWGVGLHRYDVTAAAPWMDGAESFAIPASHQDQVFELPPQSRAVAASPFTPFAALEYLDSAAISFQGHPDFSPEFTRALLDIRRDRLADADGAIASLDAPNDRARVAGWIRTFLADGA
jgi:GMP synthase-like glutamine amidotransferase